MEHPAVSCRRHRCADTLEPPRQPAGRVASEALIDRVRWSFDAPLRRGEYRPEPMRERPSRRETSPPRIDKTVISDDAGGSRFLRRFRHLGNFHADILRAAYDPKCAGSSAEKRSTPQGLDELTCLRSRRRTVRSGPWRRRRSSLRHPYEPSPGRIRPARFRFVVVAAPNSAPE